MDLLERYIKKKWLIAAYSLLKVLPVEELQPTHLLLCATPVTPILLSHFAAGRQVPPLMPTP